MTRITVTAATRRGHHPDNEDRVLVGSFLLHPDAPSPATIELSGDGPTAVAVLDGMGGHRGGATAASAAAAEMIAQQHRVTDSVALADLLELANRRVYRDMSSDLTGMGATATVVVATPREVLIGNVGNSRCYVEVGRYLSQLTFDDTRQPGGPLTQSLGGLAEHVPVEPHVTAEPWTSRRFVLVTDGVDDLIGVSGMESCLCDDDRATATSVMELIDAEDGPDDASIVIMRIEGDSPESIASGEPTA